MPSTVTIGLDVGGTKMLAGAVTGDGELLESWQEPTPAFALGAAALTGTVARMLAEVVAWCDADGLRVGAVGVAAAGFVEATGERVAFAPHLAWRGDAVRAELSTVLGLPVVLENDANAALVAEHRAGAAAGVDDVLLVTLGTGIGGAVLTSGVLVRGVSGMAGEFGHMCVVRNGRPCPCGQRGCWERYVSGTALLHTARKRLGEPVADGRQVTEAAAAGDPRAQAVVRKLGVWLGRGVAGLAAALDPELVVVGGGLVRIGDALLGPARETLAAELVGGAHRAPPPVVAATLGPEAGMRGAAALAHDVLRDAAQLRR